MILDRTVAPKSYCPETFRYFNWTKFYKKSMSCDLFDDVPCEMCEMAKDVQMGIRKQVNIRKWWSENVCNDNFVNEWLKTAVNKNKEIY